MTDSYDPRRGERPDTEGLLRPEARPLSYSQLDRQQQHAFRRIVALFEGAASGDRSPSDRWRTDGPGRPSLGIFLDHARSSRTILIGGSRGTGKTTLLLSLADALTPGSILPQPDVEPELSGQLTKPLESLRRRLVWLETLDMEPLSNTANLLGAVLARVEEAMGTLLPPLPEEDERPRTSLLYPGVQYHEAQREMLRLQTSVALSFNGNLAERAASLDPDTFAIESRRAERERLGLNRRFAQVLADLSNVLSDTAVATSQIGAAVVSPIFVLPVDDLDLNPSAAVQLLELLRAVNSPHLLTVVAADLELLSTILNLRYQGELARIAAPAGAAQEILYKGRDIAVNALRKHIPPGHRVVLGLVEPAEAFAFVPPGYSGSLYQRLRQVSLAPNVLELQLIDDFMRLSLDDAGDFARDPLTEQASLSSTGAPTTGLPADTLAGYSWPELLRVPLRTLLDLYLDAGTDRAVPGHQEPTLQELARSRLDELLEFAPPSVESTSQIQPRIEARTTQNVAAARGPTEVRTLTLDGWDVSLGYGNVLDRAEAAQFAGAVDLLDQRARPSYPSVPVVPWPRATVVRGTAWTVPWPWVSHSTCWGYERAFKWLNAVENLWHEDPDGLFGSWVAVMTAQLFDSQASGACLGEPASPWPTTWQQLRDKLDQLPRRVARGRRKGPQERRAASWLLAVGLLCTPEMGMQEPENAAGLVPAQFRATVQTWRKRRQNWLPVELKRLVGVTANVRRAAASATEDQPAASRRSPRSEQ